MFYGKYGWIIQFEDKSFLKDGLFHGFNVGRTGELETNKTKVIEEAKQFHMKWQIDRMLHDIGIQEPYTLRQVRNEVTLIPEGIEEYSEFGTAYTIYSKKEVLPLGYLPFVEDKEVFNLYQPHNEEGEEFLSVIAQTHAKDFNHKEEFVNGIKILIEYPKNNG